MKSTVIGIAICTTFSVNAMALQSTPAAIHALDITAKKSTAAVKHNTWSLQHQTCVEELYTGTHSNLVPSVIDF